MTPWRIEVSQEAFKDLEGVPHQFLLRILKGIRLLARNPSNADIKKLEGSHDAWRLKVGPWRVLFYFEHDEHTIRIDHIVPRKDAY